MHTLELLIDKESCWERVSHCRDKLLQIALLGLKIDGGYELRERSLRLISKLCFFYEESLTYLLFLNEGPLEENIIQKCLSNMSHSHNLYQIKSSVKMLHHLLDTVTTNRNLLRLITMFIESPAEEILVLIKAKIFERKYRIYESFT